MTRDVRKHAWAWAVPALVLLALGLWRAGDGRPAQMGDDAQYLLHAKALAEGRDYTDIGYIYTLRNPVVGPIAYPPGGPFLMAPLFMALEDPIPALRIVVLLMSVGFVVLAGKWALREFGPATAFAALLIVATNPDIVRSSTRPLTDLSFSFLVWGVFFLAAGAERWSPLRVAALTAFGVGAILFRVAGISLVPAMIAHVWLQRPERRRIAWIPVAVWSSTFATVNLLLPTMSSYTDQIGWDLQSLVENAARAAFRYRLSVADGFHYPFPASVANDLYHLVAAAVAFIGLVLWIRRNGRDLVVVWGMIYVALLLSYTTHTTRFCWPLFPILLCCTFMAVGAGFRRFAPRSRLLPDLAIVLLALAIVLPGAVRLLSAPPEEDLVDRQDVRGLFVHLAHRADEGEVRATFFNPRVLTLRTGIPSMGIFDGPPEVVLDELCAQRITHVILGDVRPVKDKDRAFRTAVETYRGSFTLEFENESFEVWRLDRTSACGGGR